ncbi:thioredoxin family protein, partial [bacterium]|nr:thioredoxin family protein [bacterium]
LILIVPIVIYSVMNKDSNILTTIAKENSLPTMMTFSSTMCIDCQKMKTIIQEIQNEYTGKINFTTINATDKDNKTKLLIKKHSVVLVPTMIFIDKEKNEIKRIEGAITKDELRKELEEIYNG